MSLQEIIVALGVSKRATALVAGMAIVFAAGWVGYAKAEGWVKAKSESAAKKFVRKEVTSMKPAIREIARDSRFNSCALVKHIRAGNEPMAADQLFDCETEAAQVVKEIDAAPAVADEPDPEPAK